MKRMLINATQPEELRVAIADGQQLMDLDIEVPSQEQKKSNIYKAKITRVEPSLEACFVEFGSTRHGFLPLKEISREYYQQKFRNQDGKVSIRDAVKEGQEIIIQVEKEERGNKGAALTTFISLAGRYLVLMPNNPSAGGVSRRITGDDRQHLREQLDQVTAPEDVGIIVRTAGVGREAEELQWDLDYLVQLWDSITKAAAERKAPFLIFQESNLFIRALRDHLRNDIGEILVDNKETFEKAQEFMQSVMPHNLRKLKLYEDQVPLFSRYQIESQIESAFARTVHLPSGGSIVFDPTEALLSIDINSARATKGSDIEDTACNTNLEAAEEIARQLRLRDLGGLIVIDFIDMMSRKNQRAVENKLRDALKLDKARVQTGKISRFGLLEMSRQRLRPSLGESSQIICPRCDAQGHIRSVESLALSILRLAEEEAMKEFTGQVIVQAPTKVANFLLNEKRGVLNEVELRHKVPIVLLSNEAMVTPAFEIHRVRKSEVTDDPSYSRVQKPEAELVANELTQNRAQAPVAAVQAVAPSSPAPVRQATPSEADVAAEAQAVTKEAGFFSRLGKMLFSGGEIASRETVTPAAAPKTAVAARPGEQNDDFDSNAAGQRRTSKKKTSQRKPQRDRNQADGANTRRTSKRGGKKTSKKAAGEQDNKQEQSAQQGNQQNQVKPEGESGEKKPRRRRSRGGRRRGGRKNNANRENQAAGSDQDQNQQADQASGNQSDVQASKPDSQANPPESGQQPATEQAKKKPAASKKVPARKARTDAKAAEAKADAQADTRADSKGNDSAGPAADPDKSSQANEKPAGNVKAESKAEAKAAKKSESKPADTTEAAPKADSKPAAKAKTKSESESADAPKKAAKKTSKRTAKKRSKKTSGEQTGPAASGDTKSPQKSDSASAGKPVSEPASIPTAAAKPPAGTAPAPDTGPKAKPVGDTKGIYTLTPGNDKPPAE